MLVEALAWGETSCDARRTPRAWHSDTGSDAGHSGSSRRAHSRRESAVIVGHSTPAKARRMVAKYEDYCLAWRRSVAPSATLGLQRCGRQHAVDMQPRGKEFAQLPCHRACGPAGEFERRRIDLLVVDGGFRSAGAGRSPCRSCRYRQTPGPGATWEPTMQARAGSATSGRKRSRCPHCAG